MVKSDKDFEENDWIKFCSGDEQIYITPTITADSRPYSFFSVEDIEKLTIIRNDTGNQYNIPDEGVKNSVSMGF